MLALRIVKREPIINGVLNRIPTNSKTLSPVNFGQSTYGRFITTRTSQKFFGRTSMRELLSEYKGRFTKFMERNLQWFPFMKKHYKLSLLCLSAREILKVSRTAWEDFGRNIYSRTPKTLLSAVCVSACNQKDEDLNDERYSDIDYVLKLKEKTLTCRSCHQRITVDQKLSNVQYCSCKDGKAPQAELEGWKPFIERPSSLVWRKEHPHMKGLFAYKMYGRLEGITALDFLRVQLDTDYRKKWDSSAAELLVVEENLETSSDIVYWEMQWPKPFANRDYVFQRKVDLNPERQICIISSLATSHPECPVKKSMHRVTEYWSFMVVRPLGDFNQPGVEFVLTYFDNPGLSIPSAVSTWVAMTGLPNFVVKLNEAASSVAELSGPQPMLMRYVLERLRHWETEGWRQKTNETLEARESSAETIRVEEFTEAAAQKAEAAAASGADAKILPLQQVPAPSSEEDDAVGPAPVLNEVSAQFEELEIVTISEIESPADVRDAERPAAPLADPAEAEGRRPLADAERVGTDCCMTDSASTDGLSNSTAAAAVAAHNHNNNPSSGGSMSPTSSTPSSTSSAGCGASVVDNSSLMAPPLYA